MTVLLLGTAVLLIGVSLGMSGIGGFLIPLLLVSLTALTPRQAVEAALISFVPSGLLGALLYRRHHTFDWGLSGLLSVGTVIGVVVGRQISLSLDEAVLRDILAVAVLLAAISLAVRPVDYSGVGIGDAVSWRHSRPGISVAIGVIGSLAGMLTVLVGVGGPLVAVPALMLLGAESGAVVGACLLASAVGSACGALALSSEAGKVGYSTLLVITSAQLAGIAWGVHIRSRVSPRHMGYLIAVTGAIAAMWILALR